MFQRLLARRGAPAAPAHLVVLVPAAAVARVMPTAMVTDMGMGMAMAGID